MPDTQKKILIIEDDLFIRELYADYLTEHGYSIIVAEDGNEGLNKILNTPVDLILLDVMLPLMDGIQVLTKIKAPESPAKDTPVYMITNMGQENIIKQALRIGAVGYLIKSQLQPKQILQEIENFLNKKED